jgi:hypothetical protein
VKTRITLIVVLAICGGGPAVGSGAGTGGGGVMKSVIWLEAERFGDCGGWKNDPQFIDQMGSPYLLAVGLGTPVADAVTTADVPRAGKYRLWARTKDWMPAHHPGRFQVLVSGKPCARTFGQSGKAGWRWEDGGAFELSGKVEVRLRDRTGYYARCDVVVLTNDLAWTPPADTAAIAALRERHGGVSRAVKDAGDYDVVVVGGGLAGCMAAVSAARNGAKTALVQNRPVLGGNASVEILVPPVGVWPHGRTNPLDPRETGLIEEVRTAGRQRFRQTWVYSGRLMRLVKLEPNLDLHLNTHATGVAMADGSRDTIAAVLAVDVRSGQRLRFGGRVFIDCTGDGVVGLAAGAEHRHGKEPRSMYDESLAPETGDRQTMGNSLKYAVRSTAKPQPFETPQWAYSFGACGDFGSGRHPAIDNSLDRQWVIELGGLRDTYRDAEEIRDDLLRVIYGMWDHAKNHCPKLKQQAAKLALAWVGYVAGKRESARLIGDYVMRQQDVVNQTLFPDRIAYGAWGLDDHPSGGFFHKGRPSAHPYKGRPHSVPYRSLYSKNIRNLMMAGRDISVSHVALGSVRVMLTCSVIGHAAGTAAAMCVEHDTTPRGIHKDYIQALQQRLLKEGAYLIDLPGKDPRDLARSARITASSEKGPAANVINGCARAVGEAVNAWTPKSNELPQWVQLDWERPQALNMVHVTFQAKALAPAKFALAAWRDGAWRTIAEVTDNRHRRRVLGLEPLTTDRLRVLVYRASGICEVRVYDEPQQLVEVARRAAKNLALPDGPPHLPFPLQLNRPPRPRGGPKATGVDARKLPGIVMDHAEATLTGQWVASTHTGPFVGDGYVHDGNAGKGDKSISFAPVVARAGVYEIRISYSALANRATNTPVTIKTAQATKTVRINQRKRAPIDGLFFSLGRFELAAGAEVRIVIGNAGTDGYVIADAIQLLPENSGPETIKR